MFIRQIMTGEDKKTRRILAAGFILFFGNKKGIGKLRWLMQSTALSSRITVNDSIIFANR
jgi:hypothetical protein